MSTPSDSATEAQVAEIVHSELAYNDELDDLTVVRRGVVRRIRVEELLTPDEAARPGREPRRVEHVDGDADLARATESSLERLATSIEQGYRGTPTLADLPQALRESLGDRLQGWNPGVRVRVAVDEEKVVECKVAKRRVWVGLTSKRVLASEEPALGRRQMWLKLAAVAFAFASPAIGLVIGQQTSLGGEWGLMYGVGVTAFLLTVALILGGYGEKASLQSPRPRS